MQREASVPNASRSAVDLLNTVPVTAARGAGVAAADNGGS